MQRRGEDSVTVMMEWRSGIQVRKGFRTMDVEVVDWKGVRNIDRLFLEP